MQFTPSMRRVTTAAGIAALTSFSHSTAQTYTIAQDMPTVVMSAETAMGTTIRITKDGVPQTNLAVTVEEVQTALVWYAPLDGPGYWKHLLDTIYHKETTDLNGELVFDTYFETSPFGVNGNDIISIKNDDTSIGFLRQYRGSDRSPFTDDMPANIELTIGQKNPVSIAGLRSSLYGATSHYDYLAYEDGYTAPWPAKEEWTAGSKAFESKYSTGANPVLIWIVGEADWHEGEGYTGGTTLKMGVPEGTYDANISFARKSTASWERDGWYIPDPQNREVWKGYLNHDYLDHFDNNGIDVFLQIEPSNASILDQIELIMDEYSSHKCVIGFGIDVEFYDINSEGVNQSYPTAAEVEGWYDKVKSYGDKYDLFLKHFKIEACEGGGFRGDNNDIIYIDDVQDMGDINNFLFADYTADDGMIQWANHFGDNPVWFQIGYAADWYHINEEHIYDPDLSTNPWFEPEWGISGDAIRQGLSDKLLIEAKDDQEIGLIWVDFTMRKLLPEHFNTPDFDPSLPPVYKPTAQYDEGAVVAYGGANWEAQWWTQNEAPGEHDVWQGQVNSLPKEWDYQLAYNGGDRVSFDGNIWAAQWWNKGKKPGTSNDWRPLITYPTPEWSNKQVYLKGDVVTHNGTEWVAKWWTQNDEPGVKNSWQVH